MSTAISDTGGARPLKACSCLSHDCIEAWAHYQRSGMDERISRHLDLRQHHSSRSGVGGVVLPDACKSNRLGNVRGGSRAAVHIFRASGNDRPYALYRFGHPIKAAKLQHQVFRVGDVPDDAPKVERRTWYPAFTKSGSSRACYHASTSMLKSTRELEKVHGQRRSNASVPSDHSSGPQR